MATRSTIAVELADGAVHQVYCHFDGYPSNNGKILLEHYTDPDLALALIAHGGISVLKPEIGVQRPFANPGKYASAEYLEFNEQYGNQCLFYTRDRGEKLQVNTYWNFEMYCLSHPREEYAYCLRQDGKWYMAADDRDFVELAAHDALDRGDHDIAIALIELIKKNS